MRGDLDKLIKKSDPQPQNLCTFAGTSRCWLRCGSFWAMTHRAKLLLRSQPTNATGQTWERLRGGEGKASNVIQVQGGTYIPPHEPQRGRPDRPVGSHALDT